MVNTRLRIGDYEAWVVVENEETEHYGIEVNEETMVVTCWIASTAGKHFGLWIARHHNSFDCLAYVHLDGSKLAATTLKMEPKRVDSIWTGKNCVRPFLLGTLNLTDDESFLNTQSYDELGNIKVTIHHVTDYKLTTPAKPLQLPEDQKIHEQAKKTVTHRVSFGQTRTTENPYFRPTFKLRETVATFVFRYRSLDILRANGIAPIPADLTAQTLSYMSNGNSISRKRKAIAKEEDSDVEIDPEDESDKRKEAQLAAELKRVRKARLDRKQSKHAQKKVKHEPKLVFLPGEVIDLTI